MRISTPVPGLSAWICADRLGVQPGALVGQVVAGDAGDRGVAQPHRGARTRRPGAARRGPAGPGLPVSIWQKSQRRVHWSPPMRKVASRSSQHSKMLGQPASWQTVCRPSRLTRPLQLGVLPGPSARVVRIHAGLRSIGVSALRASIRSIRRPSGSTVTVPAYGAGLRRAGARRWPYCRGSWSCASSPSPSRAPRYDDQLAVARTAEECGFDAFFRSDHYLAMGTSTGCPGRPTPGSPWPGWPGRPRPSGSARWSPPATFRLPGSAGDPGGPGRPDVRRPGRAGPRHRLVRGRARRPTASRSRRSASGSTGSRSSWRSSPGCGRRRSDGASRSRGSTTG